MPLSYLLANASRDGVYLYSVVFYLFNLYNTFLQRNMQKLRQTELENLSSNECISFSCDKELLHIAFINSNYSLESRQQDTWLEYDFAKIEQAIESTLLADKAIIDTTVRRSDFHFYTVVP